MPTTPDPRRDPIAAPTNDDCQWCGEALGDDDRAELVDRDGTRVIVHAEPCGEYMLRHDSAAIA
jgi:hypothetical protein